jgi:GTPase SAR1 family protein
MFTLLNGFYEELTFVPERRVVLLGLQSSGKTALIECMKMHYLRKPNHGLFSSVSSRAGKPGLPTGKLKALTPTVGLNVARLPTGRENVLVWDLGGAEALRPIWERYVSEAEALIWVVDSSNSAAMAESRRCLRAVLAKGNLARAPLLVYANKQDEEDAMDPVKTSLALDLLSDAELRPQCVQPSSAKSGAGVVEGLEWLVHWLRNPSADVKTSIKGT